MIKGKTKSGFDFELEDEVLDDYELLEALCSVDHGNYSDVAKLIEMLLGEEQKEALKAHLKNRDGRVKTSAIMNEISEIFEACSSGKNS